MALYGTSSGSYTSSSCKTAVTQNFSDMFDFVLQQLQSNLYVVDITAQIDRTYKSLYMDRINRKKINLHASN